MAMGLALAPLGAEAAASGVAATATATAVSPTAPSFNGQPMSWSGLKANAAGVAVGPTAFRQVRLTASGTFGSLGAALIQVSADSATWVIVAGMTDAISPGAVRAAHRGCR